MGMQGQMNMDINRVQQSYGNGMQPGYNQQGMMMQGGGHGGKMKKMKGGKHCGGKKHKKK